MKVILLFLVLTLCLSCFGDYYLSTTGLDTNSCDSDSSPCLSMAGIIAKATAAAESDLTIHVFSGTYSTVNNLNVTFPINIPVSIDNENPDDEDSVVVFDCFPTSAPFAFFFQSDATIKDISITNCTQGLLNGYGVFADMSLDEVSFKNGETGVYFEGVTLDMDDCNFDGMSTGIHITNATDVTINDGEFSNIAAYSINLDFQGNITTVTVSDCKFNNTAGINIAVESETNTTAILQDLELTGAYGVNSGSTLININGGDWELEEIDISGSTACIAVNYVDTGSGGNTGFVMKDSTIDACDTGLYFSANGHVQVDGGSFTTSTNGVAIQNCDDVKLHNGISFSGGGISITNSNSIIRVDIDNINLNNTKPSTFVLDDLSNATISNSQFTFAQGQAININGGAWGIDHTTFSNSESLTGSGGIISITTNNGSIAIDDCDFSDGVASGNGGAIYVHNTDIALDSCTFENNNATFGGAVYVADITNFSVKDTTFTSNGASNRGGAIDIETSVSAAREAYFEDVEFDTNSAVNGSAISCCGNGGGACNITVLYDDKDTATFNNNINTGSNGVDVTCVTNEADFQTAASDPSAYVSDIDSSSFGWEFWLVISIAILLVLGLIIGAIVAVIFVFYKKKRNTYDAVE